jgi:branched-chain amino acid transport system ATP-binding protein
VKISDGDPDFVRTDPKVIAAYLGVDDEEEIDVAAVKQDVAAEVKGAISSMPDMPGGSDGAAQP